MSDPIQELKSLRPEKEFFIGIDSDGCVFDTMEIKHKECFCPNFIYHYGLQPASKYAREVWEFVNLYSKTRGVNRFLAVLRALDMLARRPEVLARNVDVPRLEGIRKWTERETKLGNPALEAEVAQNSDPDLHLAYAWSLEVNETVGKIVKNVPPFPMVRESLEKLIAKADALVVSQTPFEALEREWLEHDLAKHVRAIAGQEMGTKAEHLEFVSGGKYPRDKVLMIGDAPGDLKAAQANDALFYPINPGHEEDSWQRFHDEALDKFFDGSYAGDYERELIDRFQEHLPEKAPWEQS